MKEIFFNDISSMPLCATESDVSDRINAFVKVLKFCGSLGYKHVRFERPFQEIMLKDRYTLYEYIKSKGLDNGCKLILGMVQKPYIDDNSVEESAYINSIVRLQKGEDFIEAEGLACACLSKGFAIGFASEPFWKNNISFNLKVTNQKTGEVRDQNIYCISVVEQFETQDFIDWAIRSLDLHFKPCGINTEKKKCHLRDDHGKDRLHSLSEKILKEDYVVAVINSLPFNRHARNFIDDVTNEGLIHLVMIDTDEGFGMVVKTTAETKILAKYHAADIKKKYG